MCVSNLKIYEQPALERISFLAEQSVMNMGTSCGYGNVGNLGLEEIG